MRIATITLKWVLFGLFLWNIGVFSFISRQSQNPRRIGTDEERMRDMQYLIGITDRARELGDGYTPSLYFKDLMRIELRQRHDSIHYMINANDYRLTLNSLIMQRREELMRTDDKAADKFLDEITIAQKEYDAVMDPGKEERLAKSKQEWQDGTTIKSILSWIWEFYCKNFPLAALLLYLWWVDEKKKWRLSNPLSFFICLLIYPYTIIRVWIKKLDRDRKEWAMEISFRRTEKTIFTLISEDEMAVIKRFAAKGSIADYKAYLRSRGLTPRHAFLPAMMVTTVLLLTAPKTQGAIAKISADDSSYFIQIKAPPGIHQTIIIPPTALAEIPAAIIMDVHWMMEKVSYLIEAKIHKGFIRTPEPIPLG